MKVYPFTEPVTIVCVCVCRNNCSWLKEKDTFTFYCSTALQYASHPVMGQMQFNFQPHFWSMEVQQLLLAQLRSVSVAMLPMRATIVERTKMMTTSMRNWMSTKRDNFLCGYIYNIRVTWYYSWCVATITFVYGYFSKQSSSLSSCMRIAMNWELVLSFWCLQ